MLSSGSFVTLSFFARSYYSSMAICCLFMMFSLWDFVIVVQWFCKISLMILCPIQKYT
ncbi:hypothetical protein Hanom_Chr13g01239051 [Helianthus anomalus]